MFPHAATVSLELSCQQLDDRRLPCPVGPNHRHPRQQRRLQADPRHRRLRAAGVCEGDVGHLEDCLAFGLDSLQEAWLRQRERQLLARQFVVGLRLRLLPHKLSEVAPVGLELSIRSRKPESWLTTIDVTLCSDVRYCSSHATFFLSKWLVGSSSSKISALSSIALASATFIFQPPLSAWIDFPSSSSVKPTVLSTLVTSSLDSPRSRSSDSTKSMTQLDTSAPWMSCSTYTVRSWSGGGNPSTCPFTIARISARVGQQHHGPVAQRELDVAEVLPFLLKVFLRRLGSRLAVAQLSQLVALLGCDGGKGLHVLLQHFVPRRLLEVAICDHARAHLACLRYGLLVPMLAPSWSREDGPPDTQHSVRVELPRLDRRLLDTQQRLERLAGDPTSLRVGDLLRSLVDHGLDLWHEGDRLLGLIDHLAHVLDDGARLASNDCVALIEPAREERDRDSESRGLNLLHKHRCSKLVYALGDVLGMEDAVDELGDKGLEVAVVGSTAADLEAPRSRLHYLVLAVPHVLREHWHQLVEVVGDLGGAASGRKFADGC
eukprot:753067-Hanusia_phi.AAC.6